MEAVDADRVCRLVDRLAGGPRDIFELVWRASRPLKGTLDRKGAVGDSHNRMQLEAGEPGEIRRFEEIVLPHLHAAYNLARWLVRDPQNAEDVVQEACLRAVKFFGGYRGGDGR